MSSEDRPYRVLARKYRPAVFSEMIGQEVLVRTLTNAIEGGRLAHAYLFTGVRGVGKTTTARILARAINCIGPDGRGGPTIEPCGDCEPCRAIAEDRHVDVLEIDAASHTGVDNIREIIDGVRYRPTTARFKVYIIDEVHMLSKHAFNALLKTLEEPPDHVKFVFATTEIRKIPVTVLSRCQRFDLRRVDVETLSGHYASIAGKEGFGISPAGLRLIARAADTIFIDRARLKDIVRVNQLIADKLHGGEGIVFFPESTTSEDGNLLPFKTALFEAPVQAKLPVHYLSLSYDAPPGGPTALEAIVWRDPVTFFGHFVQIALLPHSKAIVAFGKQPIAADDRKVLAEKLREAVQAGRPPLE